MALSGASEPCSTTIDALRENGRSSGRMTSALATDDAGEVLAAACGR